MPQALAMRGPLAVLILGVAGLVAGCASRGQLAEHIVDANLAQEQAANQLLLLNVLRAKDRHPMHFTKISAVRPAVGVGNPTVTIPTPFGPDFRTQIYNLQTQLAVQQSVDTVVLDSQEFMRGITTPVAPGLMVYMLDQGWPQQLVLHLFVKSIEIYEDGPRTEMVGRLDNAPSNPRQFGDFQRGIDALRSCEIELKPAVVSQVPFGPPQARSSFGNLEGLAALKTADLNVIPVDSQGKQVSPTVAVGYQVVREARALQFALRDRPESGSACTGIPWPVQAGTPGGTTSTFVTTLGALAADAHGMVSRPAAARAMSEAAGPPAADGAAKRYAIFNLRSPEAMLYYLGEIARQQARHPELPGPLISFRSRPGDPGTQAILFRVQADASSGPVAVKYGGTRYAVGPSTEDDRSMHTLSLVQQVLMLQNKGTETPGTTNVRILQ